MNEGEFKTLLDLVVDDKQIVIPIIQRDYAQGREKETELRNEFIEYLETHLHSSNPPIELDFIYGVLSDTRYTILDGQQRLTTLFLLYWYLAKLDNSYEEFQNSFSQNNFTYETRASSEEFCRSLIKQEFLFTNDLLLSQDIKTQLSQSIINTSWFMPSWKEDQTVQSILTMLDTIHDTFNKHKGSNLYQKLVNKAIGFQFLNLDNFKLTDDLYIKMNSTGLSLTHFENFKAHLENHLIAITKGDDSEYYLENFKEDVNLQKYFSFQMDSSWSDYFWLKNQNSITKFDDRIMNLFHSIFTNKFYETNSDWNNDFIKQNQDIYPPLSCKKYKDHDVLSVDNIKQITVFLDILGINKSLIDNDYYYYNENEIFKKITSGSPTYQDRLLFYAYFSFITKYSYYQKKQLIFDKHNELLDWLRVIYNLVENTRYDSVDEYARDLKAIKALLEHSDNILEYIYSNDFKGFDAYQKNEERLKARLIVANKSWYPILKNIEQYPYLKGQINFLLDISNITRETPIEEWFDEQHQLYQEKLNTNYNIFTSIFDDRGLGIKKDFLWERVLLAKGDYLISVGSNHSFCTDTGRDTSWKRCFRESNTFIKLLFEDILERNPNLTQAIEEILKQIIDTRDSSTIDLWREQFITYPELLSSDYIGTTKYIRKNSIQGFCLISKKIMSSEHTELFSLVFYLQYRTTLFNQFTWDAYQGSNNGEEWDQPYTKLTFKDTGYYICIYYYNQNYSIWFGHEEDANHPIEEIYVDILKELNFSEDEPHWYKLEELKSTDDVIREIEKLGTRLQHLHNI